MCMDRHVNDNLLAPKNAFEYIEEFTFIAAFSLCSYFNDFVCNVYLISP